MILVTFNKLKKKKAKAKLQKEIKNGLKREFKLKYVTFVKFPKDKYNKYFLLEKAF